MKSGQGKLGYGGTKEAVLAGHAAGLTMTEIAKKHGISRGSVNNCAYRYRLRFPYVLMKRPYGEIKVAILEAAAAGKSRRELVASGMSRSTVNHYNKAFNLNLRKK